MPTKEEILNLKGKQEEQLGSHLDTELEFGLEFIEEIIPFALEYFTGVKHNPEEIMDYMV